MSGQSDFLRDPDDLADVLEMLGHEIPDDLAERRQRASELFGALPATELIALFAQCATGFMRMVRDIDEFCQSAGVTIGGRIQIQTDGRPLEFSGLSSGWAFDGPSDWEAAGQRALAIAEELRYLTDEFDSSRTRESRETLTSFGRSLQGTMFEHLRLSGTRTRQKTVRAADLEQLLKLRNDVESTRLLLQSAEIPPVILSALDLATSNLDDAHQTLERHVREYGGEPSEVLTSLHNSLSVLLSQLVRLVAEVNAGQRASQGRADFLRTEFWKQRWRIYELWLLVRVLSAIRDAGATLSVNDVHNGIWNLRYGRSETPVAICVIGDSPLKVYYQLHVQSNDHADMPDITVVGSEPILVLDPKHGRSYTRKKVQRVLTRYASSFSACLTAVVNYYQMSSYPFEVTSNGNTRWLLASGITPGSVGIQRLELLIRDALLSAGHTATPDASPRSSAIPVRPTSTQASIVYFTHVEVEVDEPSGFWALRPGRGPEWLPAFQQMMGDRPMFKTVEVRASATEWLVKIGDGLDREKATVWRLSEGHPPSVIKPTLFEELKNESQKGEISPSGRYQIKRGPSSKRQGVLLLEVVDTEGIKTFPLIRCYGRFAEEYLWAPDESSVAFLVYQNNQPRLLVARLGDRHATPASLPGQVPKMFGWMTPALLRSVSVPEDQ